MKSDKFLQCFGKNEFKILNTKSLCVTQFETKFQPLVFPNKGVGNTLCVTSDTTSDSQTWHRDRLDHSEQKVQWSQVGQMRGSWSKSRKTTPLKMH